MERQANPQKIDGQDDITGDRPKKSKTIYWTVILLVVVCGALWLWFQGNRNTDGDDAAYASDTTYTDFSEADVTRWLAIDEYDKFGDEYRGGIIHFLKENDKGKDGYYFLTRIPERAKNIYCFGDFTNRPDADADIAFVAEYFDFKTAILVIMDRKGNLLYTKELTSLPVINSFKKGAKIYKNDTALEPSDVAGIIVQEGYNKYAVVFDQKSKQFKEYHQYTSEEINEINNPVEEYEEPEELVDSTGVTADTES